MKIHSNNNLLLPYNQNPYAIVPADMEKKQDDDQQAVATRDEANNRQGYKYYVRTNDESTVYDSKRRMVTQQWLHVGMLIDTYG